MGVADVELLADYSFGLEFAELVEVAVEEAVGGGSGSFDSFVFLFGGFV